MINTGDSIAHVDAVPVFLDAIAPLLERPGAFVFGSNDYAAPVFKNPARYLFPDDGVRPAGRRIAVACASRSDAGRRLAQLVERPRVCES